jgi:hypothetical protein
MCATRGSAHSKYVGLLPVEPSPMYVGLLPIEPRDHFLCPIDLKPEDVQLPDWEPSARKRPRVLARFPIALCTGVAGAWLWLSYGDAAREMVANSYWLFAPRPALTARNPRPPDVIALATPAAPLSADFAVGQSDKIATTPTTATSIEQAQAAKSSGVIVESQSDAAALRPAARLTDVKSPETSSEKGKPLVSCFASASAVLQNHPAGWPTWTLRASGHEGTMCWYAAARPRGSDHRRGGTTETRLAAPLAPRPQGWSFGLP